MNRTPIDKIYSETYLKKFVKRKRKYILIEGKEDIGNIIKNEFEDFFKILLNLKRSNRIV